MNKPFILRPTLRGMAAASLLSLGAFAAHAQTMPAQQPAADSATMEAAEAAFKRADKDGDGKLSKAEAAAMPAVAEKFAAIDKDKDGFISAAEYMDAVMPKK
jgi:Ca2+-binding EF-hand superfamily protein